MISFRVDHEPIPQPRPRVTKIGGFARAYVPLNHPVHSFREAIAAAYKHTNCGRISGAVRCDVIAVFPRPKNEFRKTMAMPAYWHTKLTDADNIAKAVLDALTGHAWEDDKQVAYLTCQKIVSGENYEPGVEITISRLVEQP